MPVAPVIKYSIPMKNLKTFDAKDEEPKRKDEVVYYSFMPLFDDDLELSESRRQTVMRLVKWLLETVCITPEEFLKQATADTPPKQ
jgi:hypothetical protein